MNNVRIKINNVPFYLGFLIIMLYKCLTITLWNGDIIPRKYALVPAFLLFCFRYIIIKKNILEDAILTGIGATVYITSKDDTLLILFLVLIVSRGIDERKIILFWYRIQQVLMITCFISYTVLLLLHSPYAKIQYEAGRTRYCFMFSHPNIFSAQLLFTLLAYIYLNYNKLSETRIFGMLVGTGIFIYVFPNSKSSAITACILGVLFIVKDRLKEIYKYFVKILAPFIIICISYFIYKAMRVYDGDNIGNAVTLLSNRFDLAGIALKMYPPKLLGQYVNTIGTNVYWNGHWRALWIDMAYIRIFITCGYIGAITFLYLLIKEVYYELKNKQYLCVLMLLAVILMGTSEWITFSVLTAFPLLFLRRYLWKKY